MISSYMKIRKVSARQLSRIIRESAGEIDSRQIPSSYDEAVDFLVESLKDQWSAQYRSELMNPAGEGDEDEIASRDSWTAQVREACSRLNDKILEEIERAETALMNGEYGS